jgi:hypothetical protein
MTLLSGIAVVAILLVGVFGMARGGEFNARYGNRLMQARVMVQGFAIAMLVLAILTRHS